MNCKSRGAQVDLMTMANRQLNFTLTSFKDPDEDWGVIPKNGIYNMSHGEWGGVMGKVGGRGTHGHWVGPEGEKKSKTRPALKPIPSPCLAGA